MKVDVYCNDYFMEYNTSQPTKDSLKNLRTGYIKGIANTTDTFILRGEPTYHYDFQAILDAFPNKNYILTTHGNNIDAILSYSGTIPYVSFNWDGFLNDSIKGYTSLTLNIMKALQYLTKSSTVVRIAYTISPYNIGCLSTDLAILRKLMSMYPNMKQPYFMLYQEGTYYSEKNFSWTNITKSNLDEMNKSGLLTEKNWNYLSSWINHVDYQCVSPQDEITVMNDATVRMCQSYGMSTTIGDLNSNTLQQIIDSTASQRAAMINCSHKSECWMSFHYKDNINAEGD